MRTTALAASVLALAAALPLAASSQARQASAAPAARTILPGYWEYDYRVGPIPAGSESKCLKAADAEQFSKGICTRKYRCDYTTNVVANGKIKLKGAWTDKKDRVAPVTADGSYTPESFILNIHMKTISGLPLAGVMTAKRVSAECPTEQATK